jgi:hypothetical protein
MAGDKVIMVPIISEEPSYQENELNKYRGIYIMCCNFSHEKGSGRRGNCISRTGLLGDYWDHYNFVTCHIDTK